MPKKLPQDLPEAAHMKPHRTGTRRSPIARAWHQVLVRPRLVLSGLAGLLVFLLLPVELAISTRVLVTWVAGAGLYLLLAFILIWRASIEHMRWRARIQDDGAAVVLFLTVAAAVASLIAIFMELNGLKSVTPVRQMLHLGLAGATFLASWLLVHTAFALHYAHAYYVFFVFLGGRRHNIADCGCGDCQHADAPAGHGAWHDCICLQHHTVGADD